jgi:DNA-binding MarR family transcriptional regulator
VLIYRYREENLLLGVGMKTDVAADPDYELWVLLHQATDAIAGAREDELRKFGISMMQAAVLFIVKAIKGPATPAEISRWLFREPHTVSGLLNRMEKQGLVKKVKDLERKNLIRVEITDKGEEGYRRSRGLQSIHRILSSLSQEERDNLRASLRTLRDKALEEPKPTLRLPFP